MAGRTHHVGEELEEVTAETPDRELLREAAQVLDNAILEVYHLRAYGPMIEMRDKITKHLEGNDDGR